MPTSLYFRAVAFWGSIIGGAFLAYRSLTMLIGPPISTDASSIPSILVGFVGDMGIVMSLVALLAGLSYSRGTAVSRRSAAPLVWLALLTGGVAFALSGVAAPVAEKAVMTRVYGVTESAYPTGAYTTLGNLRMRQAALAGSLPASTTGTAPEGAALLFLLAAMSPVALGILTVLNVFVGHGIGRRTGGGATGAAIWFFSLATTGAFLAASTLSIDMARTGSTGPVPLVLVPLVVPLTAIAVFSWACLSLRDPVS